LDQVLL